MVVQGHTRFIGKVTVGAAHIFKFHKAQYLFCMVQCMISCSMEGRQLEKSGTSFIIRLVVHLKAMACRALQRRVIATTSMPFSFP